MKPTPMRTAYNYDTNAAGDESGLECKDPSRTNQSQAKEADINEIIRRFGLTGQLPAQRQLPLNDDFMDVTNYHTAMNEIRRADSQFQELPAHIREQFDNNAGAFVDFCSTEGNEDALIKMGLMNPKPAQEAPITPNPLEIKEKTT